MKKLLKILSCLVMMLFLLPTFLFSMNKNTPTSETIFVLLDHTGTPVHTSSVMTITDPQSEIIVEKEMTDCEVIDGSAKIEFTELGAKIKRENGYKGTIVVETIRNFSLPFEVNLTYQLNGIPMNWENIVGNSGIVTFLVHFQSIQTIGDVSSPFTIQTTIPLNSKQIKLIDPGQSDVLVIGNRTNLVYANLLLDSLNWEWKAYSEKWSMESWELTFLPKYPNLDFGSYLNLIDLPIQALTKINNGYQQIRQGIQEVNNNQNLLLNGYQEVMDGWGKWIDGFDTLADTLPFLKQGFDEYRNGLVLIQSGIQNQLTSIEKEKERWTSLESKLNQAKTGFSLFSNRLTALKEKHASVMEISSSLLQEMNTQSALVEEILANADKDSSAYQLALTVRENQVQMDDIQSMLSDESGEITFLQTFWESFQKTFSEQYLPLIEEATSLLNNFISGMNSLISGLKEIDKGLLEGQQGVITMQKGANQLQKSSKMLLSPSNYLRSSAGKLRNGSKEIYTNMLLVEKTGMKTLLAELTKTRSGFKNTLELKKTAERKFRNSETSLYIVKVNFPNRAQNIFEKFQEKLRLHYNNE